MNAVAAATWPLSRLGEAVEALAGRSGLSPPRLETPLASPAFPEDAAIGGWIDAVSGRLGLEAEPVEAPYGDVAALVARAGPALFRLPVEGEARFLAVLHSGRRTVVLLDPGLALRRFSRDAVRTILCREREEAARPELDRLLDEVGVRGRRREKARRAILRERLGAQPVGSGWLLRAKPGAGIWPQARKAGLFRQLLGLVLAHAVQYALWLVSWWMVGRAALEGRFDRGWLLAWALLLLTLVPFQLLVTWLQGRIAIGAGALLKQRLLAGALRLEPEEIRHLGAGRLFGRVLESETLETLAVGGGLLGLLAVVELALAFAVLASGAGGPAHALLLAAWVAGAALVCARYFRDRRLWTEARLALTHELVERLVGHRTRLAQEDGRRWHDAEDVSLARYLDVSEAMDRPAALATALIPRGWLVLGLLGLVPAFVSGRVSPEALAISIGGILLAFRALRRLRAGLADLAGAAIAWKEVALLFDAAERPEAGTDPALALSRAGSPQDGDGRSFLEARHLVFSYRDRGEPVLRGCSLRVGRGDRLLLEGASGGGKSTLASLLGGLRIPDAGVLLLGGLDRASLGMGGWRQGVAVAPQFHENHVLAETFAFNALMGRGWPPSAEDETEVEAVCRGLGLGDLLGRMPAGLLQMVGETGWQLSHGERSRLFLARALLQGAELVVLDESFAALDPESLRSALQYVLDRARTLLVIAHP